MTICTPNLLQRQCRLCKKKKIIIKKNKICGPLRRGTACADALRHTEPQEAAARRVMAGFQSSLTRGALNADRDLRRYDLLAEKKSLRPPSPLPGKSINQPSRPSQRLTGRSEGTTQQQHFSPNKTAAVRETIIIKMNRQNHRHRIKTTTFRHNDSLFQNGQLEKDSTESIRHIYPSVYSRPQKKTLGGRFLPQPVNLLDLVPKPNRQAGAVVKSLGIAVRPFVTSQGEGDFEKGEG